MANLARSRAYDEELSDGPDEIERILAEVRSLKQVIVEAWQARGLTLHREERRRLRDEIRSTCEMLTTLTASD